MSDGPPILAQLQALLGEIEVERAGAERRHAAWEQQRVEAARRGAMGPEWQALQRRIDAGSTTVRDVMTGRDDSPEARRVRGYADRNTSTMAAELRADPTLAAEREATEEAYQQMLRDAGRPPQGDA